MTPEDVAAAHKVIFRIPIAMVEHELRQMGVEPETDIRVYPDYPNGWHATVGAYNRVYVFTCDCGNITFDVEPALGVFKNGGLIRSPIFERRY